MSTLQTHDEVELAELLLDIHPWADMARFTRAGGESMAVAVRIARAATGRDKVAICGYHGWHDWYIAANLADAAAGAADPLKGHLLPGLEPNGVPGALAGTTLPFRYNRLDEFNALMDRHAGELGAVVVETTRYEDPAPGFFEGIRKRCSEAGVPLICDEITIGWRLCLGGAHLKYGLDPDIAVFAKALGNGYAMGAVVGRGEFMQAAQTSFISSTYWTEGIGPAAALAAVSKMRRVDVPAHLARIGGQIMAGWAALGERHGLPLKIGPRPQLCTLAFDHPEAMALMTLLTARMLDRGFLAAAACNAMLAHEDHHIAAYLDALDGVFAELRTAVDRGDVKERLGTPVKHSGFARLT
jgi:glutamate-1-semialdehyde 2,1-aminomutase